MQQYRQFILRRVHSLTGVVPLGVFLFFHFFMNSFSHGGPAAFNEKVDLLRSMPYLNFLEWGGIFIPFLFHAFYGLLVVFRGQMNVGQFGYVRNWMYLLQRVTAFPVLAFVFIHVTTTRYGLWDGTWGEQVAPNFFEIMSRMFNDPLIATIYVVGILSVCFHFANGLATFFMTWGLTIGRQSQRLVSLGCAGLGCALAVMSLWAMTGFTAKGTIQDYKKQLNLSEAPRIERTAAAEGPGLKVIASSDQAEVLYEKF